MWEGVIVWFRFIKFQCLPVFVRDDSDVHLKTLMVPPLDHNHDLKVGVQVVRSFRFTECCFGMLLMFL